MLIQHLMCITIPPTEEFEGQKYQVPVYAGGNNSMNIDPVKHVALKALADEFASEDPDLHKHFMEKGFIEKTNIGSVPSEYMLADIIGIEEVEDFDNVQRSSNW